MVPQHVCSRRNSSCTGDDDDTILVRLLLLSASKSVESLLRFGSSKLRTVSVDMVGAMGKYVAYFIFFCDLPESRFGVKGIYVKQIEDFRHEIF